MTSGAIFSHDRNYRYRLWRIWDHQKELIAFIGLNPSSADHETDDPTIRRCISFAKSWGYGGFYIVNLFAKVNPKPKELFLHPAPVGPENDSHLKHVLSLVKIHVCIWGNHGHKHNRSQEVIKWIHSPFCIDENENGAPAHPLYLKGDLQLCPYSLL